MGLCTSYLKYAIDLDIKQVMGNVLGKRCLRRMENIDKIFILNNISFKNYDQIFD